MPSSIPATAAHLVTTRCRKRGDQRRGRAGRFSAMPLLSYRPLVGGHAAVARRRNPLRNPAADLSPLALELSCLGA